MAKKAMSKPVLMGSAIAFSLIIVISATYAWFTSQEEKKNKFKTGSLNGKVSIFERFTPPDKWVPGEKVVKNVGVVNTGDTPALVRISFEERIKKLKSDNFTYVEVTDLATALTAVDAGTKNPVYVKVGAFKEPEWTKLKDTDVKSGSLPENGKVEIWYSSVTNKAGTHYSFFAAYKHTNGEYIRMVIKDGSDAIHFEKASSKFVIDYNTAGNFTYCFWDEYADEIQRLWYDPQDTLGKSLPTGTKWSYPDAADVVFSQADVKNLTGKELWKNIQLNYNASKLVGVDITTKEDNDLTLENKWFYNEKDGYFYYLSVLAPESTSQLILDTVELLKAAGNEYSLMEFDLTVKMEAIATTKAAVLGQWNDDKTDNTGPLGSNVDTSKSLLQKLYYLCTSD